MLLSDSIYTQETIKIFKKIIISDVLKSDIAGTDEIGMLLSLYPESKLKFIHGSVDNIKITTQNDLNYFRKNIIWRYHIQY